jgi:4-carboxymuconolactone decarboxylase
MKPLFAIIGLLALATVARAQDVTIARAGSQPAQPGPAENFTGTVRVERLFGAIAPGRATGGLVHFEAGARTVWHTHPLGQTLIVTAGIGRVQQFGGPIQEIRKGDTVRIPANVKHWHGASPKSGMSHIAITEQLDGKAVDWLEKVSDTDYNALPPEVFRKQSP